MTKEEKEKLTTNKIEKNKKIKKTKLYLQTKTTKESKVKANLTS